MTCTCGVEVSEHPASRCLDALVATMLGWTIVPEGDLWRVSRTGDYRNSWVVDSPNLADIDWDTEDPLYGRYSLPPYSSSIEAAWSVVEKLMTLGYRYVTRGNFEGNGLHWCGFDEQQWADLNPLYQSALCESLPLAIVRAALMTKSPTQDAELKGEAR